ncbi:alpha-ketoglutarate-dependent dioxygenase AlkB [Aliikangiella maris]|uniref:Alpha-ketoglutarate-dependent dioxygenase AlkB n=2 Tax=Aliikangiella maris TaxID=3162458 RepID=A0ABV3MIY7_9GAMM
MSDLFSGLRSTTEVYPQTFLLPSFTQTKMLRQLIVTIIKQAPFRKMATPNGHYTNIPLTNCGDWGWVSDEQGYRYSETDPLTGHPWPTMPDYFYQLANSAAAAVGFNNFSADACLINQYKIGSKLGSHQDKNERDFTQPIVSVSIGLPATFQIFGHRRSGKAVEINLYDGDVMVWGGQSRMMYHAVKTIKANPNNPAQRYRYNITFRSSQ